jgi:hypothetical protein
MKFWRRNDHNSDLRTLTITVSVDDLMRLETEAAQKQMSIPEYVYVKLFAADLTPHIKQMLERTQNIDRKFREVGETLERMAALENSTSEGE